MNKVLIIGAGRSATALIHYMLEQADVHDWQVRVADSRPEQAEQKIKDYRRGAAVRLDATDAQARYEAVAWADVVISLLPPSLHMLVAGDCLALGKHLLTASYVPAELSAMDATVREKNLIFMGELGLDPGLDHMSAMERIHHIRQGGGRLTAFRSYTGGLVAPESDDNPWHYKFSWNPRNVVLAGRGTAQYIKDGKYKFIPYHRLFAQYERVPIQDMGTWEVYANRDSLRYRKLYGLDDIPELIRGTIRHTGYCDAWNALIKIGYTIADFPIPASAPMTYAELTEALLGNVPFDGSVEEKTARLLGETPGSDVMRKLRWLGLFSDERIDVRHASPARILEDLLLQKWALKPHDKDMVIMQHEFEYVAGTGEKKQLTSTLVMKGEDHVHTAMAKLVGLPLGITAKLVLTGRLTTTGVHIPVFPEVYEPVLAELAEMGIAFKDQEQAV